MLPLNFKKKPQRQRGLFYMPMMFMIVKAIIIIVVTIIAKC